MENTIDFKITKESIEKANHIVQNMEGNSFHNHYHILYDICDSFKGNITYLEIGTFCGASASLVASNSKVKHVITIDLGTPVNKETPIKNVNKFKNKDCRYDYIQGSSFDKKVEDELKSIITSFDILFIDGDHTREGVINDFKIYSKYLNNGGYIIFDDYNDNQYSPQVNGAVNYIVDNLLDDSYVVIGDLYYPELKFTNLNKKTSNDFILKKIK
jgi:predicted O-methyltransferase YrrM